MELPKKHTYVDNEIARITKELSFHETDSEKYNTLLHRLGNLQKIRQEEKSESVRPDTIVMAVVSLVQIAMVLKHERFEVITSRVFNMLTLTRAK